MEFIGVSLAVVSIVLQISELYDQIKDHSIEFHRLDQDLKCFYDALVMAKHYLHHEDLHRTRKACKDIVDDIRKLLWKRQHHSSLRRSAFKVSTSKIKDLRDRMQFHLTILHHHASELRWRTLEPSNLLPTVSQTASGTPARSVGSTSIQHDTEQRPSQTLRPIVLQSFPSTSSSPSSSSKVLPSLRSAGSRRSSASSKSNATDNTSMASCQWPTDTGFQAAKEGNIKTYCDILIALAQGARIHEDDLNQARTLLEHGALLDYTDAVCGRTPLIWAIVSGRKDLVEFFADMDASVIYTSDGASVLDTSDGKWDWTPAMWAVMENQNEILRILISKGADLNKMDGLRQRTALIWAASSGRHDSVGAILESRRAHIGLVDGAGMAPLACAYLGGHWKTAQLLLGAGDNANAEVHGASLLEWATIGTNKPFVQMLLEHGGLPNSTNSEGIPLLILAIKRNSPEIVVLLINAGADVQCTDRSGFTALMWAIWHSNMEIVAILVAAKANLYAKDNRGTTVQALAKQSGSVEIIQLVSKPG